MTLTSQIILCQKQRIQDLLWVSRPFPSVMYPHVYGGHSIQNGIRGNPNELKADPAESGTGYRVFTAEELSVPCPPCITRTR
jgi:hypothetical protein